MQSGFRFSLFVLICSLKEHVEKNTDRPQRRVKYRGLSEHLFEAPRVFCSAVDGNPQTRHLIYGSKCIAPIRFILFKGTVHRFRFIWKNTIVLPTKPVFQKSVKKRWKNFVIMENKLHFEKFCKCTLWHTSKIFRFHILIISYTFTANVGFNR
jgi:hypothetical protein